MNEIKYEIPGNNNYQLNNDDTITSTIGMSGIGVVDGFVTIPLYGVNHTIDINVFKLYCKYKVLFPPGYEHNIEHLEFKEYNLSSHGIKRKHVIVFKTPVVYKNDPTFRLVAMYPTIAINKQGDVIRVATGNKLIAKGNINTYGMVLVNDPYYGKNRGMSRHRLVALTWVENDDFLSKPIVDHKDGNKHNCCADNLEWVSFAENNRRAAEQGLKTDNLDVKVMDYTDGKIYIFGSMTTACEFMGRSRINRLEEFCNRPKLINGRYQIKLLKDTSDWDFTNKVNNKFIITLNGVTNGYDRIKDVIKAYDIPLDPKSESGKVIKYLYKQYPGIIINMVASHIQNKTGVQACCIKTGTIHSVDTRKELMELTGLSYSSVAKGLGLGDKFSISGYRFRWQSDKDWSPTYKELGILNTGITIIDPDNHKPLNFSSLREASRFLSVDKKIISKAILNNTSINGYLISKNT